MNFGIWICFAAAGLCLVLAGVSVALKRRALPWWVFSAGMILLAVDAGLGGLALAFPMSDQMLLWQRLRMIDVALLPGTWLGFSLCYSRGNYREFLKQWRIVLLLVYLVPVGAALGFGPWLI